MPWCPVGVFWYCFAYVLALLCCLDEAAAPADATDEDDDDDDDDDDDNDVDYCDDDTVQLNLAPCARMKLANE